MAYHLCLQPDIVAARQLGVPEGTVAGRLARARALLARRLTGHGPALSGAVVAALLAQDAVASVPAAVVSATVNATTLVAAGQVITGVASAQTIALCEGVLKAMLLNKLKVKTAVLVVLALAAIGGGLLTRHVVAMSQDPVPNAPIQGQKDPGKNIVAGQPAAQAPAAPKQTSQKAVDAAKWLTAAGDRFILTVGGCDQPVLFVRDKKTAPAGAKHVYLISAAEAAGVVQALVDCGLWGRSDTFPPGPFAAGRDLTLGPAVAEVGGPWWWHLGDCSDDLSSMFVIQHLLKTFKGERAKAMNDWLVPIAKVVPKEPPVLPVPVPKPQAGIGEVREINIAGFGNKFAAKGEVSKPTAIRTSAELAKIVPSKEWEQKIAGQIDLNKEYLLFFAWSGSSGDKLSFKVQKKDGPFVFFTYIQGENKDVVPHFHLYALPSNATWGGLPASIGGAPKAPPPGKFDVYKGIIKKVMLIEKGFNILVDQDPKGQLELVIFHLKDKAPIVYANGQPASRADLKAGQRVSIQYFPEILKSDPPQAFAEHITIEAAPPK